jgi:hypothetical protein
LPSNFLFFLFCSSLARRRRREQLEPPFKQVTTHAHSAFPHGKITSTFADILSTDFLEINDFFSGANSMQTSMQSLYVLRLTLNLNFESDFYFNKVL